MQDDDSHEQLRSDDPRDGPQDELHIESLDDPHAAQPRSLALMRRLYSAWKELRSSQGRLAAIRVTAVGLTLVLALTLVAVVGGHPPATQAPVVQGAAPIPVTANDAVPPVTLVGQAPTQVGSGGWEEIALPDVPGMSARSFTTSPTDPSTAFACEGPTNYPPPSSPLASTVAWRTRDAGLHWTSLPLPPITPGECYFQPAADSSARLLMTSVAGPVTYLSDNGGDSWMQIVPPPASQTADNASILAVWVTAHYLYCQYTYVDYVATSTTVYDDGSVVTTSRPHHAAAFVRSEDNGRTWQRADNGLPPFGSENGWPIYPTADENHLFAMVFPEQGQDGDSSVTTSTPASTPASGDTGTQAWETRDAGRSWHLSKITIPPGGYLLVPPRGGVDFAVVDSQVPASFFRLQVLQHAANGSWTPVPPLPVPDATADRTGLLDVYGETDDGRMLAAGVAPQTGVPSDAEIAGSMGKPFAPWLWIYDPRVARWLTWRDAIPIETTLACGGCVQLAQVSVSGVGASSGSAPGTYLWLRGGSSPFHLANVAYRLFIPDAPPGQLDAPA